LCVETELVVEPLVERLNWCPMRARAQFDDPGVGRVVLNDRAVLGRDRAQLRLELASNPNGSDMGKRFSTRSRRPPDRITQCFGPALLDFTEAARQVALAHLIDLRHVPPANVKSCRLRAPAPPVRAVIPPTARAGGAALFRCRGA